MNKQEIIKRIIELRENLENYLSDAFIISDDISSTNDKWSEIQSHLKEADALFDSCISELQYAQDVAEKLEELDKTTTFEKVCNKFVRNRILCNSIAEIDEELLINNGIICNEQEQIGEIMQYWLTDLNENDVEFIAEHHTRFYFAYSEKLSLWVMLVDHWGSSWEYIQVSTDMDY